MKTFLWKLLLVLIFPCFFLAGLAVPAAAEDDYEPNNIVDDVSNPGSPGDLSQYEGSWLSGIRGLGYINDDDWYRIEVSAGQQKVVITCTFAHADGDIDILLYDSTGTEPLAQSFSVTDDEQITYCGLGAGVYYIKVTSFDNPFPGNEYDLQWITLASCEDDCYEENDQWEADSLPDLTSAQGVWLSEVPTPDPSCPEFPLQADDDWYQIFLPPGKQTLMIDCTFNHGEGDIDVTLYDVDRVDLARSRGFTNNENINVCLENGGTYYIRVHNGNAGNAYDLRWDTVPGCGLWEVCGAVDLGGGWWWLDWFGFFNRNFDPWTYHNQHRFLYPFGNDCTGVVFWDNGMQAFWWTSATVYPYVYRFTDNEWLFYLLGSVDPRWFNILSQDIWEQW